MPRWNFFGCVCSGTSGFDNLWATVSSDGLVEDGPFAPFLDGDDGGICDPLRCEVFDGTVTVVMVDVFAMASLLF